MTAFSGVRSSWDMFARNCDLCWEASSSARPCASSVWIQPGVVDGQRRLAGERLEQRDDLGREGAGRRRATSPGRRGRDPRGGAARPAPSGGLPRASVREPPAADHVRSRDVLDLDRARRAPARPTAPSPSRMARSARRAATHVVRRLSAARTTKTPVGVVVLVEDAAIGPGELGRVRHDGRQHRRQVERGGDGLADLAQRLCLGDRTRKLGGALLKLLEQSGVLDGDDRLVGERLQERRSAAR